MTRTGRTFRSVGMHRTTNVTCAATLARVMSA
jgi:hypothetical protein